MPCLHSHRRIGFQVRVLLPQAAWASAASLTIAGLTLAGQPVASTVLPVVVRIGAFHHPAPAGGVYAAAESDDPAGVEAALVNGGSTEEAGEYGVVGLISAAEKGYVGVCKSLLAAGANSAHKDNIGFTTFHWAVIFRRAPLVAILLADPRVDPSELNRDGRSPLHLAVLNCDATIVALLLADPRVYPNAPDAGGLTPLQWAVSKRSVAVVSLLLADPRVNPNSKGKVAMTPLMFARRDKQLNARVVSLLEADVRILR